VYKETKESREMQVTKEWWETKGQQVTKDRQDYYQYIAT
jgi:hypothetical protein